MPLPLAGLLGGLDRRRADGRAGNRLERGKRPRHLVSGEFAGRPWRWEACSKSSPDDLTRFHADWFVRAVAIHAVMSGAFGLAYGIVLGWLPPMPGPLAWGGLVMPLLWTGMSFGLMGVVNPVLQQRVDWPWFIVSQFIFGMVAAIVVLRSELVYIPPAGAGPDDLSKFVEG